VDSTRFRLGLRDPQAFEKRAEEEIEIYAAQEAKDGKGI
jgi:hypothetical protein